MFDHGCPAEELNAFVGQRRGGAVVVRVGGWKSLLLAGNWGAKYRVSRTLIAIEGPISSAGKPHRGAAKTGQLGVFANAHAHSRE